MPATATQQQQNDGSITPDTPSYTTAGSTTGRGFRRSSDLQGGQSGRPSLDQQSLTASTDGLSSSWPHSPSLLGNGGVGAGTVKSVQVLRKQNMSEDGERRSLEAVHGKEERQRRPGAAEEGSLNGKAAMPGKLISSKVRDGDAPATNGVRSVSHGATPLPGSTALSPVRETSGTLQGPPTTDGMLKPPTHAAHVHRASSPPAFDRNAIAQSPARPDRLLHRHTLEVPKVNTARTSRDGADPTSDVAAAAASSTGGRFSPNTPTRRRASLQLTRRATRSIHSDFHLDEVPPDEDAARWAEHIKAKRASKRARADTDDERVVVGTKVDEHHANYETAYNMLTGIRFCVSRTNAKLDRELTVKDFEMKNKFRFDVTGNELTPGAKYDFKFKDYAPWVFRHLRAIFKRDPAEYLMSLTAKYILSELGSPGKSGSFFYFSRDYKYIIKTIHHSEHKFLRKILPEYYKHVCENPNTLLSQFYGLHRVKVAPLGRKIHFVVMNNLFPPHRDIHRTFDLKGSTIGRDFKEEELEKNPRATLKDLNWLRRNLHLEFGPIKKDVFVAQMQKDVALLQRLKIMDYSLLVGIHDLERGNEENLRDKTLQVFQPGSENEKEGRPVGPHLIRTPSVMENAKRARELRDLVKKERPVPVDQTLERMPEAVQQREFYFYADDGGFQATHEDNSPGEEIYYLGIIDCLTRYNVLKKAEHFWKGMGGHESQISPIPPDRYGDRFIRFISGITMSKERAEKEAAQESTNAVPNTGTKPSLDDSRTAGSILNRYSNDTRDSMPISSTTPVRAPHNPAGTAEVMQKAEHAADVSRASGASEADVPTRSLTTVRTNGGSNAAGEDSETGIASGSTKGTTTGETDQATTLPVIGEAAESASNASRTPSQTSHTVSNVEYEKPERNERAGEALVLPERTSSRGALSAVKMLDRGITESPARAS